MIEIKRYRVPVNITAVALVDAASSGEALSRFMGAQVQLLTVSGLDERLFDVRIAAGPPELPKDVTLDIHDADLRTSA